MGYEDQVIAMTNRSIRTIKAELEFLTDASVITPQQLSHLLSQIPAQTPLHAPISVGAVPAVQTTSSPIPSLPPVQNLSMNEKQHNNGYYTPPPPSAVAPPPAYPSSSAPPPLAHATALYAYNPTDAGDLALQPHDTIKVSEYMNAEWWKGQNTRTGAEGIFPRSYVKVVEEKQARQNQASGYGNMPLEVSQSGSGPVQQNGEQVPSKGQEMGKKFGKKLGNAAIFGAGATIGGNIVNSIF